jgi:proline dehydrogenase
MAPWQSLMIALATSARIKDFMQRNARASALASRFVAGGDAAAALATALELKEKGLRASLYYLGEYVADAELVARNVEQKSAIAELLGEAGLDVHVSVDPTQVGYAISENLGQPNAERIGEAIARQPARARNYLMLDMEDYGVVDTTLALHQRLVGRGLPAALTLQAYLRRTEGDLRSLIAQGAAVRLVKGAFAESRARAWTRRAEIARSYLDLARMMLSAEARSSGFYPIFASHDEAMLWPIVEMARDGGWRTEDYEFEMLYGVRPELQHKLLAAGQTLRLYLPFGRDWWPYAARRVGENMANARFVARAVLARR